MEKCPFIDAGLLGRGTRTRAVRPFSSVLPPLCVEVEPSLSFSCVFPEHPIMINIINKKRGELLNVKYAKFLSDLTGQFINVMV